MKKTAIDANYVLGNLGLEYIAFIYQDIYVDLYRGSLLVGILLDAQNNEHSMLQRYYHTLKHLGKKS